jgi:hypothetical protein
MLMLGHAVGGGRNLHRVDCCWINVRGNAGLPAPIVADRPKSIADHGQWLE